MHRKALKRLANIAVVPTDFFFIVFFLISPNF
jgi:hypothetical protein